VVLRQDEAGRPIAALLAFVARQKVGEDPARIGRPVLRLEDEACVGGMDDAVVQLLEGGGLEEGGFGLGTPDLAAASKLVADEHQHRPTRLGTADLRPRRRGGEDEPAHRQRPSVQHCRLSSWKLSHEVNMRGRQER
jgi:hypothetical protein